MRAKQSGPKGPEPLPAGVVKRTSLEACSGQTPPCPSFGRCSSVARGVVRRLRGRGRGINRVSSSGPTGYGQDEPARQEGRGVTRGVALGASRTGAR